MPRRQRYISPVKPPSRQHRREPLWAEAGDDELLAKRFGDLRLGMEGTWLAEMVRQLYDEMRQRGLTFKPHTWLSSEWFSPDGVPGIAIPFYLGHRRLMALERKQMFDVEGGTRESCLRILRHEAGHCIDTAYRLHFRKDWREVFGPYSQKYPEFYQPKPYSHSFVQHLDMWYAQAHPAEDFAETFAVWLGSSRWRARYRGWPALAKLEYVDQLMAEIAQEPPRVRNVRKVEPLSQLKQTLAEHYKKKRMHYGTEWPDFYDENLRRIFSDEPRYAARSTAAKFLNAIRPELRRLVSEWTGEYQYTIDQVLVDMIHRCRELKLRLAMSAREARLQTMVMVAVQTTNYLNEGRHRVAL